jgi:hypothetical protein
MVTDHPLVRATGRAAVPLCSACGAACCWAEDAWTCTARTCGAEWDSDHDRDRYAAPADQPEWEAVLDSRDRRRVVYWRLATSAARPVGAVSRKENGRWRALAYPAERHEPNTELGMHDTRRAAERAVERHAGRTTTLRA